VYDKLRLKLALRRYGMAKGRWPAGSSAENCSVRLIGEVGQRRQAGCYDR